MFLVPSSPSHVIYSFVNCLIIKLWPFVGNSLANKTLGGSSYNLCWLQPAFLYTSLEMGVLFGIQTTSMVVGVTACVPH